MSGYLPPGSRWLDKSVNRIIVILPGGGPDSSWWYYEDDSQKSPHYCCIHDFFVWGRFERIP